MCSDSSYWYGLKLLCQNYDFFHLWILMLRVQFQGMLTFKILNLAREKNNWSWQTIDFLLYSESSPCIVTCIIYYLSHFLSLICFLMLLGKSPSYFIRALLFVVFQLVADTPIDAVFTQHYSILLRSINSSFCLMELSSRNIQNRYNIFTQE